MAKKILTNLDLTTNQLLNAVAHVLTSAPEQPKEGQIYYDSTLKKFRYYNGTEWVSTDPQDVVLSAEDIVNLINNSGLKLSRDTISGLSEMLDSVKMAGNDIITEINAVTTTSKIDQSKIAGLNDLITQKEIDANAYADIQQNNAVAKAKQYVNAEIAKLIGGASEAYDTFKEIEDFLKLHDSELAKYKDIVKKYTTTIGDGVATEHSITHALNTRDCVVQVYTTTAPYEVVVVDVEKTDVDTVLIRTATPISKDELTVVIVG